MSQSVRDMSNKFEFIWKGEWLHESALIKCSDMNGVGGVEELIVFCPHQNSKKKEFSRVPFCLSVRNISQVVREWRWSSRPERLHEGRSKCWTIWQASQRKVQCGTSPSSAEMISPKGQEISFWNWNLTGRPLSVSIQLQFWLLHFVIFYSFSFGMTKY